MAIKAVDALSCHAERRREVTYVLCMGMFDRFLRNSKIICVALQVAAALDSSQTIAVSQQLVAFAVLAGAEGFVTDRNVRRDNPARPNIPATGACIAVMLLVSLGSRFLLSCRFVFTCSLELLVGIKHQRASIQWSLSCIQEPD
jgi:hypothetical protein